MTNISTVVNDKTDYNDKYVLEYETLDNLTNPEKPFRSFYYIIVVFYYLNILVTILYILD